jgi:hypothetical protein
MAPSTRCLSGELRVYDVRDLTRVDSHLRELRHRLKASGPEMLPRIWADIDLLLGRRAELTAKIDT